MIKENADTLLDIVDFHSISVEAVAKEMEIETMLLKRYIKGTLVWNLETLQKAIVAIEKVGKIKIKSNELYEVKHRKYV